MRDKDRNAGLHKPPTST